MPVEILSIDFIATPPPVTDCVVLILGKEKEGRSVTITDEFRTASGYGSVWIVATGADLRLAVISDSHGRLIAPPNSSFPQ